jgi:hypothetical protein
MREREQTQGEPEQAMPQVGRTLIANEGEYRQVQRKPNAHDFQNHSHGALTVQYLRPFRAEPICKSLQGMRVRCTNGLPKSFAGTFVTKEH